MAPKDSYSDDVRTVMRYLSEDILFEYVSNMNNDLKELFDKYPAQHISLLSQQRGTPVVRQLYPYSESSGYLVRKLGESLRPFFSVLFHKTFVTFVITAPKTSTDRDDKLLEYMVTFCAAFFRYNYPAMEEEVGVTNMLHVKFLLCCAFLAENIHYSMTELHCYRCVRHIQRVLMVVYDRWVKQHRRITNGFHGLAEYSGFLASMYQATDTMCKTTKREEKVFFLKMDSKSALEIIEAIDNCPSNIPKIVFSFREIFLFREVPRFIEYYKSPCPLCAQTCELEFIAIDYPNTENKKDCLIKEILRACDLYLTEPLTMLQLNVVDQGRLCS